MEPPIQGRKSSGARITPATKSSATNTGSPRIKAHYAYARGATGEGVTLGIVDSGVDPSHPKFQGKLEASYVGGYDPDFSTCDEVGPDGACVSGLGTWNAGRGDHGRRTAGDSGHGRGRRFAHSRGRLRRQGRIGGGGTARPGGGHRRDRCGVPGRTPRPSRSRSSRRGSSMSKRQLERELRAGHRDRLRPAERPGDGGQLQLRRSRQHRGLRCAQELRERLSQRHRRRWHSQDTAAAERTVYVWAGR